MKYFSILSIISITLFISACQKKDVDGVDKSKLVIGVTKPTEGQLFHKGDTVFIKGTANYITELHGYEIEISNNADSTIYLDIDEHLHDSAFDIDTFWVNTLDQNAALQMKLTVEIDHDGNEDSKTVNFNTSL